MKLFPDNISTYGHEIDELFYLIFVFASIAFFISVIALLIPVFRKREKAKYFTGEKWTHLKWVAIPLTLLAICDFIILGKEHSTWVKIEQQIPEKEVHIGIIGRQWNWIFVYPGPDNTLWTLDDKIVDEQNSELHVPVNKKIVIDIRAKDVLHSVFIPVLRFKQDAIPGRTITRWFEAIKPGKYEIWCAEICGVLHSRMRNFLVVEDEESYQKFTAELYKEKKEENLLTVVK
jgi:cytochrome c oxidase subunit 2